MRAPSRGGDVRDYNPIGINVKYFLFSLTRPHPEEHRAAMRLEEWGGSWFETRTSCAPTMRPGKTGGWNSGLRVADLSNALRWRDDGAEFRSTPECGECFTK